MESEEYLGDFLSTLLNMIKFNPAYLDPEIVCGLIHILGQICVVNTVKSNIDRCLEVGDTHRSPERSSATLLSTRLVLYEVRISELTCEVMMTKYV